MLLINNKMQISIIISFTLMEKFLNSSQKERILCSEKNSNLTYNLLSSKSWTMLMISKFFDLEKFETDDF